MEMILAFPLDPKAFHSPSPFCFFPVAISKGCQYWKLWLNRYSCAPHNYSKTVFMLVSSNLQHSGFWHSQRERAGRLWGSVYNMKPLIKWLRSWKHFAIRDIQRASLQNESIYRVVHQFHTDLASLGASRRTAELCFLLCSTLIPFAYSGNCSTVSYVLLIPAKH